MRESTTLIHTRAPGSEPHGRRGHALQTLQASAGLCGAKRQHCSAMPKLGEDAEADEATFDKHNISTAKIVLWE